MKFINDTPLRIMDFNYSVPNKNVIQCHLLNSYREIKKILAFPSELNIY